MITGEITLYQPSVIPAGQRLDIFISFNAYNEGGKFWNTRITVDGNNTSGSDNQNHPLEKGSREAEKISLGTMPNRTVTGTIKLEGRGYGWGGNIFSGWDTLDYKSFTVSPAVKEAVIAPPLSEVVVPSADGFRWPWEPKRPTSPQMPSPTTPTFYEPFKTVTPEEEKNTLLWVGLAMVAVIGAVVFLR